MMDDDLPPLPKGAVLLPDVDIPLPPGAKLIEDTPKDDKPSFVKAHEGQNKPKAKPKPVSMNPADYPPGTGRIAPPRQHSDLYHDVVDPFKEAWEAVREGQIGRAFGISTETAEARKEDPSTPLLRFNSRPTGPLAGAQRGLENFATGLTTPTNLLLAVGSGGLGALEGQLGRSLLSRLASAGFSGQMLHGAYQQIPALRDAWNKSDWQEVQRVLTEQVLGGKFAYQAGKHAVKSSPPAAGTGGTPSRHTVSLLVDTLKPPGGDVDFHKKLNFSLPEIKQTEAETGQSIKGGVHPLLDNIKHSKKRVWGQFEDLSAPLMDTEVDLSSTAKAIRDSITKTMRIEHPETAAQLNAMADKYDGLRLPFADVEKLWHEGNAELDSYYAKNPAAQRSAAGKNPDTAANDAKVRELRNTMYNHLDMNGGAAARAVMERYGALRDLEGHATRHYNDALRTVPGIIEGVLSPESLIPAMTGFATGHLPGGLGAWFTTTAGKTWLAKRNSINAKIDRAIAGYEGTPTELPRPVQQLPLPLKGKIDTTAPSFGQMNLPFESQVPPMTPPSKQWRLPLTEGVDVPASSSMQPSGQTGLPFGPQVTPTPQPFQPFRLPFTKEGVHIPASEAMQSSGQGALPFGPQPTPLNRLKLPGPAPVVREEFRMPPAQLEDYRKPPGDFTWKPPEGFPDIEHKNYIQRWNPRTQRYDIIPKEEHRRGGLLRYPTRQQVLRSLAHGQSGG